MVCSLKWQALSRTDLSNKTAHRYVTRPSLAATVQATLLLSVSACQCMRLCIPVPTTLRVGPPRVEGLLLHKCLVLNSAPNKGHSATLGSAFTRLAERSGSVAPCTGVDSLSLPLGTNGGASGRSPTTFPADPNTAG